MKLQPTRIPGKFKVDGKDVVLVFKARGPSIVVSVISKQVNRCIGYAVLTPSDLAALYREAARYR